MSSCLGDNTILYGFPVISGIGHPPSYYQETRFCSCDFFHLALDDIYHNDRHIASLFFNELDTHTDRLLLSSLRRGLLKNPIGAFEIAARFFESLAMTCKRVVAEELGCVRKLDLASSDLFSDKVKVWTVLKCIILRFLKTSGAFDLSIVNCQ